MLEARVRLAVAAILFCGWLGWLGYLAFTATDPVVLSRPQFVMANIHVLARLSGDEKHPDTTVTIEKVLWPADKQEDLTAGAKLKLSDLAEYGPGQGWNGPGEYLLPLTRTPSGAYAVTVVPLSPGFNPKTMDFRRRIYRASPQVLSQLEQIQP